MSALLRLGAGRLLPGRIQADGTDSIETLLADVVRSPVRIGIFLGPPRANRKPVLQVLSPDGELLAIAKVGTNPLTARLATAEAEALRLLAAAPLRHTVVPTLLGLHTWHDLVVMVQSPLPIWEQGMRDDPALRRRAMLEIATSQGVTRLPWSDSEHRRAVDLTIERITEPVVAGLIRRGADHVLESARQVDLGAWHGDLTAWNLACAGDQVLVWDWERFSTGVPVGFDLLHHHFLPSLKGEPSARAGAGAALLDDSPGLLRGVVDDPEDARTVALLYLLEIGGRFAVDGQARTGTAGGDVVEWLRPVIDLLDRRKATHG